MIKKYALILLTILYFNNAIAGDEAQPPCGACGQDMVTDIKLIKFLGGSSLVFKCGNENCQQTICKECFGVRMPDIDHECGNPNGFEIYRSNDIKGRIQKYNKSFSLQVLVCQQPMLIIEGISLHTTLKELKQKISEQLNVPLDNLQFLIKFTKNLCDDDKINEIKGTRSNNSQVVFDLYKDDKLLVRIVNQTNNNE